MSTIIGQPGLLFAVAAVVAVVMMIRAGLSQHALVARRESRRCPSCDRHFSGRFCPSCGSH
jgi:rRNA maturation endonuclease Nob1